MYGTNDEFYEKAPDQLDEQEAKQALMYWRGKFEATNYGVDIQGRLDFIEQQLSELKKSE